MKNKHYTLGNICFFISFFLFFFVIWLDVVLGNVYIDKLIFHLLVSQEGTNYEIILQFLKPFCIATIFFFIFFIQIFKKSPFITINLLKKQFSFFLFPFRTKNSKTYLKLSVVVFTIAILFMMIKLQGFQYLKNQITISTFYEEHYVNPNDVKITFPDKKRNLIYIFLESMETGYSSYKLENNQVVNLIPNLTNLANANINISNNSNFGGGRQAPATGWTIAAIVAQTAGINLNIPIDGNSLNNYNIFIPGVTTIGDILQKEGYNQVFLLGSDSDFGGRKNYFTQHGNYKLYDLNYAKEINKIDKDYHVYWGYEDQKLFTYAQEELLRLSQKSEPFNLTILTVDTHFYDGYVDNECELKFEVDYANAINCSDKKIGIFIDWVKQQSFYENTTIILTGDHLTTNNNFLKENSDRLVYNTIINSAKTANNIKNREFTILDMFPTTLASMGVNIEGNKLGLGTNLLSEEKTLIESLGVDLFERELSKKSKLYRTFFY
ncbi:MAG: sulfatase-like hydrolase/transferase [Tenericutes bacterium]|nr:sulfatase-like hydrolase/transferase [Mycoplasmatota bacterium]